MITEELKTVNEWDKTFPKSSTVGHTKVTFINRYGITLCADMYTLKMRAKKCLHLLSADRLAQ